MVRMIPVIPAAPPTHPKPVRIQKIYCHMGSSPFPVSCRRAVNETQCQENIWATLKYAYMVCMHIFMEKHSYIHTSLVSKLANYKHTIVEMQSEHGLGHIISLKRGYIGLYYMYLACKMGQQIINGIVFLFSSPASYPDNQLGKFGNY